MALQRIASRLAQQAIRLGGRLTAVNAKAMARRAAEKILKSYSKRITQAGITMDIAKAGVKLDPENAMERTITQAT